MLISSSIIIKELYGDRMRIRQGDMHDLGNKKGKNDIACELCGFEGYVWHNI